MRRPRDGSFHRPSMQNPDTPFHVEFGVLWGFMNPKPRPTFNTLLLDEACDFSPQYFGV